ncbi:hypothetical protein B0H16DRAFT_1759282, partial [Mycena metata]
MPYGANRSRIVPESGTIGSGIPIQTIIHAVCDAFAIGSDQACRRAGRSLEDRGGVQAVFGSSGPFSFLLPTTIVPRDSSTTLDEHQSTALPHSAITQFSCFLPLSSRFRSWPLASSFHPASLNMPRSSLESLPSIGGGMDCPKKEKSHPFWSTRIQLSFGAFRSIFVRCILPNLLDTCEAVRLGALGVPLIAHRPPAASASSC